MMKTIQFHLGIGMASFIVALVMILFALIYDKSQIHVGTGLYAQSLQLSFRVRLSNLSM